MKEKKDPIYDAEMWAELISASLPTFANPKVDFDIAHEAIIDWLDIIIDTVRNAND